ncbi:hypothetical protein KM043_010540 [Ampulex compressa]|nr:hypothetical protein KM043_010540 [Ampulex compressa]
MEEKNGKSVGEEKTIKMPGALNTDEDDYSRDLNEEFPKSSSSDEEDSRRGRSSSDKSARKMSGADSEPCRGSCAKSGIRFEWSALGRATAGPRRVARSYVDDRFRRSTLIFTNGRREGFAVQGVRLWRRSSQRIFSIDRSIEKIRIDEADRKQHSHWRFPLGWSKGEVKALTGKGRESAGVGVAGRQGHSMVGAALWVGVAGSIQGGRFGLATEETTGGAKVYAVRSSPTLFAPCAAGYRDRGPLEKNTRRV